jgi:hypothetical protein
MSCPVRNAAARQNTIPGRKKATSHASRPPSRSIPVKPSTDIAALWATTSAQCPRSGAARAGWRVRQPHPHLLAHEFQILASNGASQPALWPVLPALAGTGGHHAGQISQRRLPDTSPFGHEVLFAGFPDGGQAGPTRRLTEPTAPARPHGRCLQTGGVRQPHPHLLAHVFQMTGFTWEYFGLRVDFGYRAAQKTPRSPNPPDIVHHRTLAPYGTQVPAPPEDDRSGLPRPAPGTWLPDGARRGLPSATLIRAGSSLRS